MKFGALVLWQFYHNQALLAKTMATVQVLTRGRFIAGLGAEWKEDEYRAHGYPFPVASVRIEQLREAVQVLKRMWQSSPVTLEGRYYSVHRVTCEPLPDPLPPFLIGGGGERLTLRLVADEADLMNLAFATPEEDTHKLDVLRGHCHAVGSDRDTTRRTLWACVALGETTHEPIDCHGRIVISGGPREFATLLQRLLDPGLDHFTPPFLDHPRLEGAVQFIER